ncbi:MAG: hypothetical protein EA425_01850 [Puniceicoccaceae bacterium]|nr:MAG: hypothetical protein EA425_01850 [Puniceicoccaceae bacterium]
MPPALAESIAFDRLVALFGLENEKRLTLRRGPLYRDEGALATLARPAAETLATVNDTYFQNANRWGYSAGASSASSGINTLNRGIIDLLFDPRDNVVALGFVALSVNNFQYWQGLGALPDNPNNYRVWVEFSDGTSELLTGTTSQANNRNKFFGIRAPEGAAVSRLMIRSVGRNFRTFVAIDDLTFITEPAPPYRASPATATGAAGRPFYYRLVTGQFPTSIEVEGLPAGLAFDPESSLISGTPAAPGEHTVIFRLENDAGVTEDPLTLTISEADPDRPAPTITSAPSAGVVLNRDFLYQIETDLDDADPPVLLNYEAVVYKLTESGRELSSLEFIGFSFSDGLISGTPSRDEVLGDYEILLVAFHDQGGGELLFTLSIVPPTPPPDFDGDQRTDLVFRHSGSDDYQIWLMDGLQPHATGSLPGVSGAEPPRTGDFNASNRADILRFDRGTGRAVLHFMDGLTDSAHTIGNLGADSPWRVQKVADFNGDLQADVLWFNPATHDYALWLIQETDLRWAGFLQRGAAGWELLRVADFSGDGRANLLWRNPQGAIEIWNLDSFRPDGQVGRTVATFHEVPAHLVPTHTGDLNGNGRQDILWRNQQNGEVTAWFMDGIEPSTTSLVRPAFSGYVLEAVGDLDGDNRADLLWRGLQGEREIWYMDGATAVANVPLPGAGPHLSLAGLPDLDGDSRVDLLWTDTTTGDTIGWLNSGTLAQTAGDHDGLGAFLELAGIVALDTVLAHPGPATDFDPPGFTLFAPLDEAFAGLPAEVLEELLLPANAGLLASVLLHHVVPGNLSSAQLLSEAPITLNGRSLDITLVDGELVINGRARVLQTIPALNGTLHIIDDVLLPDPLLPASVPSLPPRAAYPTFPDRGLIRSGADGWVIVSSLPAPPEDFDYGDDFTFPPAITGLPAQALVAFDGTLLLNAQVVGTGPLSYQWSKDGQPLPGETGPTLRIDGLRSDQAGAYRLQVTSPSGSATSAPVVVAVEAADFAGVYFGNLLTMADAAVAGYFGIYVRPNQTAVFMAFLADGTGGFFNGNLLDDGQGGYAFESDDVSVSWTHRGSEISGQIGDNLVLAGERSLPPVVPLPVAGFGFYPGVDLGGGLGEVNLMVGPAGDALLVSIDPAGFDGGRGFLRADGVMEIETTGGLHYDIEIDPADKSVLGAYSGPDGLSGAFMGFLEPAPGETRFVNISTRGAVGVGAEVLIGGFIVSGFEPKPVLIRALGPALAQSGLPADAVLADPRLRLFQDSGLVLKENTAWGDSPERSQIEAASAAINLPLPAAGSRDAIIHAILAPGAYTAQVSGVGGTTGLALIEVYDAAPETAGSRFFNISTRGIAGPGSRTMIAGFVIHGTPGVPKKVLIRGLGPELGRLDPSGVLASRVIPDPVLRLFDHSGQMLEKNENWNLLPSTGLLAAVQRLGATLPPAGSLDAMLLVDLLPGVYTVHLTNRDSSNEGLALIEVFELDGE